MQEQKEEDRIVAKSKPTAMSLTSTVSTRSSSVNHPIASKSLETLKASTGKLGKKKFKTRRSVEFSRKAERRIPWRFDGWSSWEMCRDRKKSGIVGVFWIWTMLHPEVQKFQGILKLEEETGHIIFICLQQLCLTWRKSIRSYDKCTAEVQRMTCIASTWIARYGVYSWTSRFKPQFTSWSKLYGECTMYQESTPEVCETVVPSDWKVDHGSERNNGLTTRLITKNLRGDRRRQYVTKLVRSRMPKPTSSSTRCSVSEAWEMMEFEWKVFPGFTSWRVWRRFKRWWLNYNVNLSSSKIGSSSSQCTTTL